jgi:hypothetical protein
MAAPDSEKSKLASLLDEGVAKIAKSLGWGASDATAAASTVAAPVPAPIEFATAAEVEGDAEIVLALCCGCTDGCPPCVYCSLRKTGELNVRKFRQACCPPLTQHHSIPVSIHSLSQPIPPPTSCHVSTRFPARCMVITRCKTATAPCQLFARPPSLHLEYTALPVQGLLSPFLVLWSNFRIRQPESKTAAHFQSAAEALATSTIYGMCCQGALFADKM